MRTRTAYTMMQDRVEGYYRGPVGGSCYKMCSSCLTSLSMMAAWWCPEWCPVNETAVLSFGPSVVSLLLCLTRSTWGFQSVLLLIGRDIILFVVCSLPSVRPRTDWYRYAYGDRHSTQMLPGTRSFLPRQCTTLPYTRAMLSGKAAALRTNILVLATRTLLVQPASSSTNAFHRTAALTALTSSFGSSIYITCCGGIWCCTSRGAAGYVVSYVAHRSRCASRIG